MKRVAGVVFDHFGQGDDHPMKRCALCGGRLGLISHRKGMFRFCKLAHKTAYIERERKQQKAEHRRKLWFDFLGRRSA
jgi:ssDNA-binding Zn-finger/Zn-ribbon topoisomerase 1